MEIIYNKKNKYLPKVLLIAAFIVAIFLFNLDLDQRDRKVLTLTSDRSLWLISKCIDEHSEKFHPELTQFSGCTIYANVNGYCGNGSTFIAPDGEMRVVAKMVDGRSEIWITHTGELPTSAIDAAKRCQ